MDWKLMVMDRYCNKWFGQMLLCWITQLRAESCSRCTGLKNAKDVKCLWDSAPKVGCAAEQAPTRSHRTHSGKLPSNKSWEQRPKLGNKWNGRRIRWWRTPSSGEGKISGTDWRHSMWGRKITDSCPVHRPICGSISRFGIFVAQGSVLQMGLFCIWPEQL